MYCMKKSIYAFLIVAIVIVAIVLIVVKNSKAENQESVNPVPTETTPSETNNMPDMPGAAQPGKPSAKLPAGSAPVAPASALLGKWAWLQTTTEGKTIVPTKSGKFSITFETDGKVGGTTDCNGFFGSYKAGTEGVLSFGPVGSTLMFCEGSQESEFTGPLANVSSYAIENEKKLVLKLKNNGGSITLQKVISSNISNNQVDYYIK